METVPAERNLYRVRGYLKDVEHVYEVFATSKDDAKEKVKKVYPDFRITIVWEA